MAFKKSLKISFYIVLILSFVSCLTLILSFALSFDKTSGYFESGSALPIIAIVCYSLGCIASFAPLLASRDVVSVGSLNTLLKNEKNGFALLGTVCILFGALGFLLNTGLKTNDLILYLLGLGTMSFGAYFLLLTGKNGYKKIKAAKILILLLCAAFPTGVMFHGNSDYHRAMNSVENYLSTVFGVAFLLFILYEGKRVTEEAHSPMHFASMLLLLFTGTSFPLAYTVSYLMESVNEEFRLLQVLAMLLFATGSLLCLLRVMKNSRAFTKTDEAEMEAIIAQLEEEVFAFNSYDVEDHVEEVEQAKKIEANEGIEVSEEVEATEEDEARKTDEETEE